MFEDAIIKIMTNAADDENAFSSFSEPGLICVEATGLLKLWG